MNHTPGPWRVINSDMVVGHEGQLVADCERTPHCERPASPTVEAMANAHLIAAAPELLEALKNLLYKPMAERTIDAAKRAIAKAERMEVKS